MGDVPLYLYDLNNIMYSHFLVQKSRARKLHKARGQVSGVRVQGAGCRVQGAGCRVQSAGCRVQGAESDRLRGGRREVHYRLAPFA